jgi:hypothetical protein
MEKIEWQAPEYIYKEKTPDWYRIVGIITISIAIIAIILNNIIFGILIIISASTLSLYATRKPEIIPVEINDTGIKINTTFHPFSDLESFWIETRDAYPRILFKSKKKISLYIVVMLGNTDSENIREMLSRHLVETEHSEPFLEKVLLYLGF